MSRRRHALATGLWPARSAAVVGTKLATDPAYAAFAKTLKDGGQYPPAAAWIDVESVLARSSGALLLVTTPLSRDQVADRLAQASAEMSRRIAASAAGTAVTGKTG